LRLGELINLSLPDVYVDLNHVTLRSGKGNKDRTTLLGRSTAELLKRYLEHAKPRGLLFEGQGGGSYSARSL